MPELDYHIRELELADFENGFIDCLEELTAVGNISPDMFKKRFLERNRQGLLTIVAVSNNTKEILGTASMFYEPKFIHECSVKAYIEDVCVSPKAQKKGIGKSLVQYLENKAMDDNCYKIILTCSEEKRPFYQKMDFKKTEIAMAIYTKKP